MTSRRIIITACITVAFLATFIYSFNSCKSSTQKKEEEADTSVAEIIGDFVGDKKCGSCHQKEYAEWKISDHAKAILPATDSTVEGNFNNATFIADGVTSRFFRREKRFFVNTQGPDGSNHDYEIKYTFGYYPLQQYLVEFPGGRMQALRACWDVNEKKWFHQYPKQAIDHRDWLHWTRPAQNWNAMCAACHSTNLQTNYDAASDTFNTTWSILNVSCEACHGPGKEHVRYISSADYGKKEKVAGSYLVLHSNQTSADQLVTCAPCHSRRLVLDENPFRPLQLLDHYIPEVPHTPMYHADGQIHDEDYEFGSFTQTRMYMHNVKCSNCHNPHSGKLLFIGNALCSQCHDKSLDSPAHTFHAANTEGSQCINCHMPTKNFMEIDVRRDHSMRVPRPDQSVKYGTPNACNQCHTGKSAQWSANQIVKWFGPDRRYHFSDDLIPGSLGRDSSAAAHLQKLSSPDTNVPAIIHATALYYMSFVYDPKNIQFLLKGLHDPDAMIRYEALRSLRFYPVHQWTTKTIPLLHDPVKAVRVAAADLLLEHKDSISKDYMAAFASARRELDDFLAKNAAEPGGRVMMADVQSRLKNYSQAEHEYLMALRMDSLLVPARINLATMYDIIGKKEEALKQLKTAFKIEPGNEQVNYYLALLYVELNENNSALNHFSKAAASSKNTRVFYNYGLLLEQMKRDKEAEKIYRRGLVIDPDNRDLNYIMALFYYKQKRNTDALPYAIKLMQLMPRDPNYQQLYQALTPQ